MIKPRRLQKGDLICIVSPSSEIKTFPRRLQRGISSLEGMGFKVMLSRHALEKMGNDAGSAEQKAQDLMDAFTSADVAGIMASTGGYTSNTVLEHLDYKVIADNPKVFVGYSDITALLLGLYAKTGMVTFHGPSLLPSFGDKDGVHPETAEAFRTAVSESYHSADVELIRLFMDYSEDSLFWDKDDDRPRSYSTDCGPMTLHNGTAKGRLIGGNLDTLLSIISTEYCPDFNRAILCLEEANGTTSKTIRNLKTLEYHGLFNRIGGLLYARSYNYNDNADKMSSIQNYIQSLAQKYDLPTVFNVPFGHTEPRITLPIGAEVKFDARELSLKLSDVHLSI